MLSITHWPDPQPSNGMWLAVSRIQHCSQSMSSRCSCTHHEQLSCLSQSLPSDELAACFQKWQLCSFAFKHVLCGIFAFPNASLLPWTCPLCPPTLSPGAPFISGVLLSFFFNSQNITLLFLPQPICVVSFLIIVVPSWMHTCIIHGCVQWAQSECLQMIRRDCR